MFKNSLILILVLTATGLCFGDVVLDSGDVQYGVYSGNMPTVNYTDPPGTITDPVTRVVFLSVFDLTNLYLSTPVDLSIATSFDVDVYGDGSGALIRFSFYVDPYDDGRLYQDVTINFSGWQHLSINFADMSWHTPTSMTKAQALISSVGIFQMDGAWNGVAGTIYIDDATIVEDSITPPPPPPPPPPVSVDAYNEHHNLISNPYAEQDFTDWYYAANADILNETASVGTKCFRLSPAGTHSDIRSITMPIDALQVVKFGYSFKSLPGSTMAAESSYADLRCFDKFDTYLGGNSYELELTNDAWLSYEHELMLPAGTTKFDIVISTDVNDDGSTQGQFLIDDIFVYRELYPLGLQVEPMDSLQVIRKSSLNNPEFLMMQTLQGILAQTKPKIYIDEGRTEYLDHLVSDYGITYIRSDSIFYYFNTYGSSLSGYILYDINDQQSMLVASSMAGILQAVMVDVSLEATIQSYGLSKVLDARGKNCQWVYQNYWDQFNHNGIMMKQPNIALDASAYYMRDFATAQKLMWWWDSNYALTAEVLDSVIDNSHIWGWDDPAAPGELGATSFHSQYSLYTGATAAVCNVSVMAAVGENVPGMVLAPKNADNTYTTEDNVHYVCFMMSDMDNMGTELGAYGWHVSPNYFANANRGNFPMGWGLPASFMELAPSVMDYWYDMAYETDSFSTTCSGLGYSYASQFPDLENHTRKLGQLMERSGQRTTVVSDHFWPAELTYASYYDVAHQYTRLDPVRGVFFFDVNGDYARYGRMADIDRAERIYWFDRKPFVPCRYTLWESGAYAGLSSSGLELASTINSLPTDPSDPDGYTFVMVHAWSFGYQPMNEIAITVANLDSDVRVVTPDELIEQIYMNLSPCGTAPIKSDINDDCEVNFEDFAHFSQDWLDITDSLADLWDDGKVDMKDFKEFVYQWLD